MSFKLFRKNKIKLKPTPPTGEELFVQYYFDEKWISYKREYKLGNLKGDTKSYRVVDFYLPKLNVYVEYFGMYNSTKEIRNEYDKKVEVYLKNHIPTVVIYPHELGFLDFTFHRKVLNVLRMPKFKKWHRLFFYKLNRYWFKGKSYYLLLSIVSLILGGISLDAYENTVNIFFVLYVFFFSIAGVLIFKFFSWIVYVFFYDH